MRGAGRLGVAAVPALVFAGLVVATFAAFFVTTRLKRAAPVVEQLTFRRSFSPNRDGRFDVALLGFRLRRSDDVTVSIVTRDGDDIRNLVGDVSLARGRRYRFRWDGRTDTGGIAPNGEYHVRVGLRRQGRTVTSARKLFLDTVPPRPVVRYVSPASISPDGAGGANHASLRFVGPTRHARMLVYRTDLPRPRLVATHAIPRGKSTARWDGRTRTGKPAPTGAYLLAVQAQDAAGNVGPRRLPPPRKAVRGNPGLAVRYVAASRPLLPVAAGGGTRFRVSTDGRRYRWSVRRLASRKTLARGSSRASDLAVRVPRGRAGVAILAVRVGSHRYETPFPVHGRRRERVLVVLPAGTWQARNPLEADGDGYPDVLPLDPRVALDRAFAGNGLPPGFAPGQSGLLRFLDDERSRYELTTDLALAARDNVALARYTGVLFAGAPRFAPARLGQLLRAYVQGGGRVAWVGRRGFEWSVVAHGTQLERGRRSSRPALLGERLRLEPEAVPLAVLSDRVSFFEGVPGSFGPFGPLEESQRLPSGARLLASAGTGAERPSLVVYRAGDGIVARVGIDGFGHALRTSPVAQRIMRRLWVLLSR